MNWKRVGQALICSLIVILLCTIAVCFGEWICKGNSLAKIIVWAFLAFVAMIWMFYNDLSKPTVKESLSDVWHDAKEELPETDKEVFVICKHSIKHYGVAKYNDGSWWEYYSDDGVKGWASFEGRITQWAYAEDLTPSE